MCDRPLTQTAGKTIGRTSTKGKNTSGRSDLGTRELTDDIGFSARESLDSTRRSARDSYRETPRGFATTTASIPIRGDRMSVQSSYDRDAKPTQFAQSASGFRK